MIYYHIINYINWIKIKQASLTNLLLDIIMLSKGYHKIIFILQKLPRGLLKNCMVAVSPANRGKCRYKNLYPCKLYCDEWHTTDIIEHNHPHTIKKNMFMRCG